MAKSSETTTKQIASHFTRVAIASLLMMWGVVNLVFNFLNFRRIPREAMPEAAELTTGVLLVLVTGLLPFLIGLIWLWLLMGKKSPDSTDAR